MDTNLFGSTCKANAEKVHNLTHWKYHLNEWILDWLTNRGYFTDAEIVQRARMSDTKLRKYANEVVDRMEQDGEIEQLYRHLRLSINEARGQSVGMIVQLYGPMSLRFAAVATLR